MIEAGRVVYFLRDMFCEPGFGGGASPSSCGDLLARFDLSPVAEESLHSRHYALYRLAGTRGSRSGSRPRV